VSGADLERSTLRIAHTEASRGWGGQEIRILTEAAGMRERGHDVVLYCPPETRIAAEAAHYGVPATLLPIGRKRPAGVLALRRAMLRDRLDVINTHSSTDTWLAALAAHSMRGAPALVRTRHVSVPLADNAATRWLYRRATTRVVTTGEVLRDQLVRDNGIAPERIDSVPTGIDARAFAAMDQRAARLQCGLSPDAAWIGIVATLRSWKGHRHLVRAMQHVRAPDARLVIVGDGPQRDALEVQIETLKLRDRVLLAGHQRDVAPWLAALDVFALPSYANEGVPQAMLQAMFAGIPVVTTDAGAIPEIAQHDVTALVVRREDPMSLAAAIDRLLSDRVLATALAQRAKGAVEQRYTREAMLDRMEAIFRRATKERATGAGTRA